MENYALYKSLEEFYVPTGSLTTISLIKTLLKNSLNNNTCVSTVFDTSVGFH